MEQEIIFLKLLLSVAILLGPLMSYRFFLYNFPRYRKIYYPVSVITIGSLIINIPLLIFLWPIYCLYGFYLNFVQNKQNLYSIKTIASFIPFIFSLIAAIWLLAGTNDLYLLGYNKSWSYYAALHGNYLGWLFTGCFAFLAKFTPGKVGRFYTHGCFILFGLFLMIALGIDGIPYLKPIGVIGLTLLTSTLLVLNWYHTKNHKAKALLLISLVGFSFTMSLAVLKEFSTIQPAMILETPTMVIIHGMINGIVVIPLLYLGIRINLP